MQQERRPELSELKHIHTPYTDAGKSTGAARAGKYSNIYHYHTSRSFSEHFVDKILKH